MTATDFSSCMQQGEMDKSTGRLFAAIVWYEEAAKNAPTPSKEAQAFQMIGNALRIGGDIELAEVRLKRAYELASTDPSLRSRIAFDLAMTLIENLLPGRRHYFERVTSLLEEAEYGFPADSAEHWMTIGLMGRAELLFGNRHEAHVLIAQADRELRQLSVSHLTYELDNLMWLLRSGMLSERLSHLPRAVSLMRQTYQTYRYKELFRAVTGSDRLNCLSRNTVG